MHVVRCVCEHCSLTCVYSVVDRCTYILRVGEWVRRVHGAAIVFVHITSVKCAVQAPGEIMLLQSTYHT